jgi:predicted extracellular nuclease
MSRFSLPFRRFTALFASVSLILGMTPIFVAAVAGDVRISEIRIDQTDADNDEYFELSAEPGTSLDGLTYLVIGDSTGGSGVIESVTALTGLSIPASGFFVAAEGTFTLGAANLTTALNFENGDNVTHLLVDGFTGVNGADLDTNDDGVLDVTPWTEIVDLIALIREANPPTTTEYHYGPPTVGPDGTFVPGHAYRCDDTWNIGGFTADTDDTPGAANPCGGEPPPPPAEEVKIHAVQGVGDASPMVGDAVIVEGIVVGDFQGADKLNGFFLQEEDVEADGNPLTSEGVFIFDVDLGVDVAVGDLVRVTGTVTEFFDLTEINEVTEVVVVTPATGGATATPLTLPAAEATREAVEGMWVTVSASDLYVTDTFNLHRFGELWLGGGHVIEQPTNELPAGAAMEAMAAENMERSILLDDGSDLADEDLPAIPYVHATTGTLRVGDSVDQISAVVSYGFGQYRLHPVVPVVFAETNPRPVAPDVGGELTVAVFNVLNYWTTIGCGFECRGAQEPEQLAVQTEKLAAAIMGMDADIVGLVELENLPGGDPADPDADTHTPIRTLVAALNDAEGSEVWAWVGPANHYNAYPIRNEIIYRIGAVTPVGEPIALEHPAFDAIGPSGDPFGRPPLAQTFADSIGAEFSVVVNHFKSKGSVCDEPMENADGQGNCNLKRVEQAEALLGFVSELQAADPDVLVLGDMNAYMEEDPILELETELLNLVTAYDADPYSYQFFATFAFPFVGRGSLDHALATETMADQVTGTATWHINADEPRFGDWFNPDTSFDGPWKSSDHDPVLIGLSPTLSCFGLEPTIVGTPGDDVLVGTNRRDVIMGLGGNDVIDGRGGDDVICGGSGDDTVDGGSRDDLIDGGAGVDFIEGGSGDDTIDGGADHDVVDGGDGDDTLLGSEGNDVVLAGSGRDTVEGGPGDDVIFGDDGNDALDGGDGFDRIFGDSGRDACTTGEVLVSCNESGRGGGD